MKFIPAKCPNCQGDLQVPDDRDFVKCMYCGTDIKVRDSIKLVVNEHLPEMLKLAETEMNSIHYDKEYYYYTKALEIDSKNSNAWFGKGQSVLYNASSVDYIKLEVPEMKECFTNAIQYSDNPEITKYKIENFVCSKVSVEIMTGIDVEFEKEMGQLVSLALQNMSYINALEYAKELNPNHIFNVDTSITFNCEKPEQLILIITKAMYHVKGLYQNEFQDYYNKYYSLVK